MPAGRGAYLQWLASSRSDPTANIGFVFLYFYGLEYRLFRQGASADRDLLVAEVERLLSIYGANDSFNLYARAFLIAASAGSKADAPPLRLGLDNGYEIPLDVRVYLGRKLAMSEPLSADDALLWVAGLPDHRFRTPALRCVDEFKALWGIRFAKLYVKGFKVSAPKTHLSLVYRAASGTFEVPISVPGGPLPDVAAVVAPVKRLRDLVEECTASLEGFSRYVGRQPEDRESANALMLLPQPLQTGPLFTRLKGRVADLVGGAPRHLTTVTVVAELLGVRIDVEARVPQGVLVQIAQILDRFNYGIEPDRRFAATSGDRMAPVVLFEADQGGHVDPTRPSYQAARAVVEVGILAAAADGAITAGETESVCRDVANFPNLTANERQRLTAYVLALQHDLPKHQAVMQRIAALPDVARAAIARAAVSAVTSDGKIETVEVKFLERLYSSLGLPVDDVYAAMHRANPTGGSAAGTSASRTMGSPDRFGIILDPDRLSRQQEDTAVVSSLLAGIFADEPSSAANPIRVVESSAYPGLDGGHTAVLEALVRDGKLTRDRFEALSRANALLPDGAIETINDWGFDHFDEALLSDEDDIFIVEHLRASLSDMRVSA